VQMHVHGKNWWQERIILGCTNSKSIATACFLHPHAHIYVYIIYTHHPSITLRRLVSIKTFIFGVPSHHYIQSPPLPLPPPPCRFRRHSNYLEFFSRHTETSTSSRSTKRYFLMGYSIFCWKENVQKYKKKKLYI